MLRMYDVANRHGNITRHLTVFICKNCQNESGPVSHLYLHWTISFA